MGTHRSVDYEDNELAASASNHSGQSVAGGAAARMAALGPLYFAANVRPIVAMAVPACEIHWS